MIAYDTTASFPTYVIAIPDIVDEDDFDAGQTERGKLQERGGLARLNAFQGEDLGVTNTALDCATFFVADSSIGVDSLRNAVEEWDEYAPRRGTR